eukprot:1191192-Prymnesium_polylepis.1
MAAAKQQDNSDYQIKWQSAGRSSVTYENNINRRATRAVETGVSVVSSEDGGPSGPYLVRAR